MVDSQDLRYPIGKYQRPAKLPLDHDARAALIHDIEHAPAALRAAVQGLSEAQLDTPYRPGGWTIRQVVHHVPDSHLNGYTRMKLSVTEENPAIKAYEQARWAELPDVRRVPIDVSLALLDALHVRWIAFLRGLSPEDFQRTFLHPDLGVVPLDVAVGIYAWHGKHHTAHITNAVK
jgi:DinB family protein